MTLFLSGCGNRSHTANLKATFATELRARIKHVVIIVQENRSFDNLFHGYPGANWVRAGRAHNGTQVVLQPTSLAAPYDLSHSYQDFLLAYDHGKMDGFDLTKAGRQPGARGAKLRISFPQYRYVPTREIQPYFAMAKRYVLADDMFQSNMDQSFAAHLYLVGAQSVTAVNIPTGRPWGCDAGDRARVLTLHQNRKPAKLVYPCFSVRTIADELDERTLEWRYYAPKIDSSATWQRYARERRQRVSSEGEGLEFGQLWNAFDAIDHIRFGPDWENVISPESTALRDFRRGDLPAVAWVIPSWKNSDHPLSKSTSGPQWVTRLVNAIGESPAWKSTAIFVLWDDSGGWYDHVRPPQLDFDGLGNRIPMLVVSPFAKRGHVTHEQYEFGSVLKFAETAFGLAQLSASDRRAHSLDDCFDFQAPARSYEPIPLR